MENQLTHLPPEDRLHRKEVMFLLKWSRATLWRRERDGLRFVDGTIEVRDLIEWIEQWARRPQNESAKRVPASGRVGVPPAPVAVFGRRESETAH
jgi:hypothetical protein